MAWWNPTTWRKPKPKPTTTPKAPSGDSGGDNTYIGGGGSSGGGGLVGGGGTVTDPRPPSTDTVSGLTGGSSGGGGGSGGSSSSGQGDIKQSTDVTTGDKLIITTTKDGADKSVSVQNLTTGETRTNFFGLSRGGGSVGYFGGVVQRGNETTTIIPQGRDKDLRITTSNKYPSLIDNSIFPTQDVSLSVGGAGYSFGDRKTVDERGVFAVTPTEAEKLKGSDIAFWKIQGTTPQDILLEAQIAGSVQQKYRSVNIQ